MREKIVTCGPGSVRLRGDAELQEVEIHLLAGVDYAHFSLCRARELGKALIHMADELEDK